MASHIGRGTPVGYGKVRRVKFSLEEDVKAQNGSGNIALLFLYPRR
jgi:hypothetical protein